MKTIQTILAGFILFGLITACGGDQQSPEAKRAKLEKLKAQTAELNSQIKTIEEDLKNQGQPLNLNEKITHVAVMPLAAQNFEHFIDVQGRVDGDENIMLMPKGSGPVTKIYVKAGSSVKKDQVLAEIYNDAQAAQYASLKANAELAKDVYNRQKSLWEKGVGSEIQYLQAKANKESTEKQLSALYESLDMTKIKSPINGTIDEVMIKVGQMASPAMAAFKIVNYAKLKVKADISEAYASKIHNGDDVVIEFPDINKSIRTKVTFSAKTINTLNRTFGIEIELPNSNDYIPNMIAVVRVVDYQNPKSLVVPINLLQASEGHYHVFVAENLNGKKTAVKKEIQLGKTYNDKAEILSGLKTGDLVITTGYSDLNDGEAIQF